MNGSTHADELIPLLQRRTMGKLTDEEFHRLKQLSHLAFVEAFGQETADLLCAP